MGLSGSSAVRGASLGRGLARFALALVTAGILVPVAAAQAAGRSQPASIGQYSEVSRSGGFDTCWYDNGKYDGGGPSQGAGQRCTPGEKLPYPGEFVDPVGFAVDTQDQSIFVLDRISNLPGNTASTTKRTEWRLQKLDAQGNVLGADIFSLPDQGPARSGVFNYEMLGLAVDPAGVVYATVIAYCDTTNYQGCSSASSASGSTEYVEEVVAWSTTPRISGGLAVLGAPSCPIARAPATTCPDRLTTGQAGFPAPGVVSLSGQLSSGGTPEASGSPQIVGPEGLAIGGTGSGTYLAIEGADTTANMAGVGITQVCVTGGATCSPCPSQLPGDGSVTCYKAHPGYGDMRLQWSALALSSLNKANGNESSSPPAGISTVPPGNPNAGDLTVLIDESNGQGSIAGSVDVVNVPQSLLSPATIQSSLTLARGAFPVDFADIATSGAVPELSTGDPNGTPTAATQTAGPQVVGLSPAPGPAGASGFYAGDFEPDVFKQQDLSNPDMKPGIWTAQTPGVRLLQPLRDKTLANDSTTNPPLTTVVNTLGADPAALGGPPGAACTLTDPVSLSSLAPPVPSLAAGAGGAVWVLTRGVDSSGWVPQGINPESFFEGGRYLIELAPQQGKRCPGPQGTFTMAAPGGTPQSTLPAIQRQTTVTFDACPPPSLGYTVCPPTGSIGISYLGAAPEQYTWDFGDGTVPVPVLTDGSSWALPTTTHTYTAVGVHHVTLTVQGDFGAIPGQTAYVATGTVTVNAGSLPFSSFTWSQPARPPLTVNVDASASTPTPTNAIIDYHWEWGDGQIDDTATPTDSHRYGAAGNYTVKLIVIDSGYGHSNPQSETVAVTAPPTRATTAAATAGPRPPPPPSVTARIAKKVLPHRRLAVTVTCPASQTSCTGTVLLRTATALAVPRASGKSKNQGRGNRRGRSKRRKPRVYTFGHARFALTGGHSKTLYITLSPVAVSLYRWFHPLHVLAAITDRNAQGTRVRVNFEQAVRFPAKAKAHQHHHR